MNVTRYHPIPKPGERVRGNSKKVKDWRYYGEKLTKVFNRWIRFRDTRQLDNGDRMGLCITCRKPKMFDDLEACHYIPSQYLGTRWHEKNVNAGCAHCNKWLEGNRVEYAKEMPKKWEAGVLDELAVAKKLFAGHPSIEALKARIEDYKGRLKEFEP